jgi:hypothetical protein
MSNHKINRDAQFNQYLIKWGLSGYTVGVPIKKFYMLDIHVWNNPLLIWQTNEYLGTELDINTSKIQSLPTFLKRTITCKYIVLFFGGNNKMIFDNFDELKQYMMIEKLGIKNYG